MIKIFFLCLLVTIYAFTSAQESKTSLKADIVAIDVGVVGSWLNYERHLSGLFTLKSEVGLPLVYAQTSLNGNSYHGFSPSIKIEPRYYYNFNQRVSLGKETKYNASNYLALSAIYFPGLFTISNHAGLHATEGLNLIGKWGIKRIIGERFNFEFAIGIGVGPLLGSDNVEAIAGLDLRFGYILW